MFSYEFDKETGGINLINLTTEFSKEPRPVYAQELDYLGINKIWLYDKQQNVPYMWAEAGRYFYYGEMVFQVTGGGLYENPTVVLSYQKDSYGNTTNNLILPKGVVLNPIDLETMCKKNIELINELEQITVKKIFAVYKKFRSRLDCFHVAFSGGKDSVVLLDLVKKALPNTEFLVVFGDTQMEFPDTYALVDKIEQQCKKEGISFYRATSNLTTDESWNVFGPPSRVLRWCCSVHKACPQTLKIREILDKKDYVGLDFVGVRKYESAARAKYEELSYSKKQKGQYSHNSILFWNSAEIWLYIYTHNLLINETYKKGNSRAGCLYCPMGGGKGDFFQYKSYHNEMDKYINFIMKMDERDKGDPKKLVSYVTNGGWNARKNGRDLSLNKEPKYIEEVKNGKLIIHLEKPATSWQEWMKTIDNNYLPYAVEKTSNGYTITIEEKFLNDDPTLKRRFKQVFKKAAYCAGCQVCEMNCRYGRLSFKNGLKITNCIHCGQCHEIDSGCLVYNSVKKPQEGIYKMKSINSFANHAPKIEWIQDFVEKVKAELNFWENNSLGPNQVDRYKTFLRECKFIDIKNKPTKLAHLLVKNGYADPQAWSVAYANFAYNAECSWYIHNMEIGKTYSRDYISQALIDDGVKKNDATSIINAFKRFCDLPLGTVLNFGKVSMKGRVIHTLERLKVTNLDPRALLYSLYLYAENCGGFYQFTLSTLMDLDAQSTGISPVKIFGYDRDDLSSILRGLSANYAEYINVSFTHDLETISLRDEIKSEDVMNLF